MKRLAYDDLLKWKNYESRKPLIIKGARQVGKTWLMKTFGQNEYKKVIYLNFENNVRLKNIFSTDYNIDRIISALEIESGEKIDSKNTLFIFDEIQEVPKALTSLKYFYEESPHYHVIAAGSLLGTAMHLSTSFPVGKVDFLQLNPMSFYEFLMAMNEKELLELIKNHDWEMIKIFKTKFIKYLKEYYYIGGMPEVVKKYVETKDFNEVRNTQKTILITYEHDFSKHAPFEIVPRIRMVWNSIPSQLAKENRKFIYGQLRKGARAKDFEIAIQWLIDAGLILKVNRVNKPNIPLVAYKSQDIFKLFLLDTGLLSAMTDIDIKVLLEGSNIFEEFKGALTEQFVHQQLVTSKDINIFYWASETTNTEIDFIVQVKNKIIPIEVKSSENLKAKSLKFFNQKYKPNLSIRTSTSDYRIDDWLVNIPLFAIQEIENLI